MRGRYGQGRFKLLIPVATAAAAIIAFVPAREANAQQPAAAPEAAAHAHRVLAEDAELADVFFVDPRRGWAVGDRGVIWHTADGGQHWELQSSTVDCRLDSVFFLDAQTGWAAGGYFQPQSESTSGVLIHTRDGGRTWAADRSLVLPRLKRVRFLDRMRGYAIGDDSPLLQAGVFFTDDGGQSWAPVATAGDEREPTLAGWIAGAMVDPTTGAAASRDGRLAFVRRRSIHPAAHPPLGLRRVRRIEFLDLDRGWLAGDGGLLPATHDSGASWREPPPRPQESAHFDWRALAIRGRQCWVVGSPGTRVLHTPDGGQTWELHDTGWRLPLAGLSFVDDRRGWAVGAMGAILATEDGGHSWRLQRAGGARTALLGVFTSPRQVPLEVFGLASADEGYLATASFLSSAAAGPPVFADPAQDDRAHAALVSLGACGAETAWQFPIAEPLAATSAERLLRHWNALHDGHAAEVMEEHLVAMIRTWQPEVLLTSGSSTSPDDPAARLVNQLVLRAADLAHDASAYPHQLGGQGLTPWQVRKVFACLGDGRSGDVNISPAQFAPRLGRSLAAQAGTARRLLMADQEEPPQRFGLRLLLNQTPQSVGSRDLFSGISLHPGGDARRLSSSAASDDLDTVRRSAQRQRNIQAILSMSRNSSVEASRLLGQLDDLVMQLEPDAAGELLFDMAAAELREGRAESSAEFHTDLVRRYPNHRLAPLSLVWLTRYYASGEAAWLANRNPHGAFVERDGAPPARLSPPRTLGQVLPPTGRGADAFGATGGAPQTGVRAQGAVYALDETKEQNRQARAIDAAGQLAHMSTHTASEPTLLLPLAAAYRATGRADEAGRNYANLLHMRRSDAWQDCAEAEGWLLHPAGEQPKPMLRAVSAAERPKLDAEFDEPFWQRAEEATLVASGDATATEPREPTTVRIAYDETYLYMAIECPDAPAYAYRDAAGTRPRDADLKAQDRVDLMIDIDRDWTTYYRLSVDHRGWTADRFWNEASWNPQWFVARRHAEGVWRIEAAIAFDELAPKAPEPNETWVIGLQRLAPAAQFAAWSQPASPEVRSEGFGYLMFSPPDVR